MATDSLDDLCTGIGTFVSDEYEMPTDSLDDLCKNIQRYWWLKSLLAVVLQKQYLNNSHRLTLLAEENKVYNHLEK